MSFGPTLNQGQYNQVMTSVAQQWLDAATASAQLYGQVNGAGGTSWLEAPPLGYDPADSTAILALIGQFNQLAQLVNGQADLPAAFDFLQAFAVVLNPTAITV